VSGFPYLCKGLDIFKLHLNHAAITIYETSLNFPTLQVPSVDPSPNMKRVDDLWSCFTATKAWVDTFFSHETIPISLFPQVSMTIFTQLAHCLIILCRLSTFESPSVPWDCKKVRGQLDLGYLLKIWCESWDGVPEAAGLILDSDEISVSPWVYTKKKLQPIANWWEMKLAAEAEKEAATLNGTDDRVAADLQFQTGGPDFITVNSDFWDESWMTDIFGQRGVLYGSQQF
jgi:hypothetical protein